MLVLGLDRIIDWGGMKGVGAMAIRRCASANEGTPPTLSAGWPPNC